MALDQGRNDPQHSADEETVQKDHVTRPWLHHQEEMELKVRAARVTGISADPREISRQAEEKP
jgi:hypothetical protein